MRTDQFTGFKNAKIAEFCISKGINQIICPAVDHRSCGVVERCIQTINWKLGAMQLDPNFDNIQSATKTILEDICTIRHNFLEKALFEFHYGRKPNTEWSLFRDKFINSVSSDQEKFEKSMLKPENMRGLADSRTRPKVAK